MLKKQLAFIFIFLNLWLIAQDNEQQKDELYIRRFAKIAIEERINSKIPASIKLGQGLLETAFGQSELAKNANNHFGIKCKETWTGETYRYTDDAYMECFRKYPSPIDSYRDHSQFLITRKHYAKLFTLDITDYKGWAHGLKKAGYATNPNYAPILIGRIEKYKLFIFDNIKLEDVNTVLDSIYPNTKGVFFTDELSSDPSYPALKEENKVVEGQTNKPKLEQEASSKAISPPIIVEKQEPPKKIVYTHPLERIKTHINKGLKYITVDSGETLNSISKIYEISVYDLKKYNDITDETQLLAGQKLFFEEKLNKGAEKYYRVKKGDTMYKIAQDQAIKLKDLYEKNALQPGQEPKVGEVLYLRKKK